MLRKRQQLIIRKSLRETSMMMIIVIRKCLAISYHAVKCYSLLSREAGMAKFPSNGSSSEKAYWQ